VDNISDVRKNLHRNNDSPTKLIFHYKSLIFNYIGGLCKNNTNCAQPLFYKVWACLKISFTQTYPQILWINRYVIDFRILLLKINLDADLSSPVNAQP